MEEDKMTNLPLTLITHFYNEEYLLPFWIEWHKKLSISSVIMIDYNSTDKSNEIIKRLAPDWKVIPSRNSEFNAHDCDAEVMDIEKDLMGWKLVLNTTEFLMLPPDTSLLNYSEETRAISCSSSIIVGPNDCQHPESLKEFISGFNEGFISNPNISLKKIVHSNVVDDAGINAIQRSNRFIHNSTHGHYSLGRHNMAVNPKIESNSIYIAWVGYYPWNDETVSRKLQIKNKIPQIDKERKLGYQHLWEDSQMSAIRQAMVNGKKDLCQISEYNETYRHCLNLI